MSTIGDESGHQCTGSGCETCAANRSARTTGKPKQGTELLLRDLALSVLFLIIVALFSMLVFVLWSPPIH